MSTRITKRDAEQALRVYCTRAGVPYGHYVSVDNASPEGALMVLSWEQNGRTFAAQLLHRGEHKSTYVLTGGLTLQGAYGGWQVQRIIGDDPAYRRGDDLAPCTGVTTPFGGGYHPAREIYLMLSGAIAALEGREQVR